MTDRDDDDGFEDSDPEFGGEPMVERPLSEKAVRERMFSLATLQLEILDLEDERTEVAHDFNSKLKKLKAEMRRLATEVKSKAELVPAQITLAEAAKSRKTHVRPVQTPEA